MKTQQSNSNNSESYKKFSMKMFHIQKQNKLLFKKNNFLNMVSLSLT